MRTIANPTEFREKICTKLSELLDDKLSAQSIENMEKSIYNYCVNDRKKMGQSVLRATLFRSAPLNIFKYQTIARV